MLLPRRDRFLVHHFVQHFNRGRTGERHVSRQHFVKDNAEGVDVGLRSEAALFAAGLFRSHVLGRTHDLTVLGLSGVVVEVLGEAEVRDLGLAIGGEQDVARLEIAVQDLPLVRVVNGSSQAFRDSCGLSGRNGFAIEVPAQRAALHVFEHAKWSAANLAHFKDLNDVGMLESGHGFDFRTKPRDLRFGSTAIRKDHLDGDVALERRLPGTMDDAHAAAAQRPQVFESGW